MLVVRKGMFQSTHPRGVRLLTVHLNFTYYGFNPRTHVGCDDEFKERFDSITFQSTHPRGVRLTPSAIFEGLIVFQSTHPRGVRPSSNRTARHRSSCFNPRTHVGCDRAVRTVFTGDALSFNPRTHVGCDPIFHKLHGFLESFNPRTHVGCDLTAHTVACRGILFQSTHPRGVRPHWRDRHV